MLRESLPPGMRWLGFLPPSPEMALPERHLGLVQAGEVDDLDRRMDAAAAALGDPALWLPDPVRFTQEHLPEPEPLLAGLRIAIARDAAFAFLYPANLAWLTAMGAQLTFFSPLADRTLPECDALWLPGGYPELHLAGLSQNHTMLAGIRAHHSAGKPILAECGGMLYCLDALDDGKGHDAPLLGILPGKGFMQSRLAALGLQSIALNGGTIRGHTFHYSRMETPLQPHLRAQGKGGAGGEAMYRQGSLWASYLHLYFPSNTPSAAAIFRPRTREATGYVS